MMERSPVFRASLHFLSPEKGGRPMPAYQGYRPTIFFDGATVYMGFSIAFLNKDGQPLQHRSPLPPNVTAEFAALSLSDAETRSMLFKWAKVGQAFSLTEGTHVVARGRIIWVNTSLLQGSSEA
jgi:hypothetical protein